MQKLNCVYDDVERRHLEAERPWPKKVCDQLTESNDDAHYFLNPMQNMATMAMMLRSILESSELEANMMYQNLHDLMERATIQPSKIDRQFSLDTENHDPQTIQSWSMRAQTTRSTRRRIPMRDRLEDIRDA